MHNAHDDLPHPIPAIAYLRWKENYFFILKDPDRSAFGIVHVNSEPLFDRLRINANFQIGGRPYRYANTIPYPPDFAMSPTITDGHVTLDILESHKRFRLRIETDALRADVHFDARFSSFDFNQCKYSAPDLVPFKEVMTLATQLPFEHLQQAMRIEGTIAVEGEAALEIDGYGYRDHSWGMRTDNIVASHTWCGFNFPDRAFGVMTIRTLFRPEIEAREGYVVDAAGMRILREIAVEQRGGAGGLADTVVHTLVDVLGGRYTIESDVAGRLADVPLAAEAPAGKPVYEIAETFCRSRIASTGETGIALIELGRNGAIGGL